MKPPLSDLALSRLPFECSINTLSLSFSGISRLKVLPHIYVLYDGKENLMNEFEIITLITSLGEMEVNITN